MLMSVSELFTAATASASPSAVVLAALAVTLASPVALSALPVRSSHVVVFSPLNSTADHAVYVLLDVNVIVTVNVPLAVTTLDEYRLANAS